MASELEATSSFEATVLLAIEGPWNSKVNTKIPKERYLFHDLKDRLQLDKRFDLAICMEVAEHLTPGRATSFVSDLCRLSDFVLFPAAVPGQGGVGHLNERWQDYRVSLFAENGYSWHASFRNAVLSLGSVPVYYRQNAIVFYQSNRRDDLNDLNDPPLPVASVLHPDNAIGWQQSVKSSFGILKNAIRRRDRRGS